jgi:tetratricopeptide (TPR) repeat protein
MADLDRLKAAMNGSIRLSQLGQNQEALKLLDDTIAEAIQEGRNSWMLTLSRHAAVLCSHRGDLNLAKHYYEQALAYNPENSSALYGLACVSLQLGDTQSAKEFAKRSYEAILRGDDDIVKAGLLDLIVKQWPEITTR